MTVIAPLLEFMFCFYECFQSITQSQTMIAVIVMEMSQIFQKRIKERVRATMKTGKLEFH